MSRSIRKIVVLRSGAVGDCIVTTPALEALRKRFPDAQITLVGDPFSADVFLHSPHIDRVIALDSKRMSKLRYVARLLSLRMERFSLLIDMHGNGRSFVQTLLIGGHRRLGFDIRPNRNFAYSDLAPLRSDVHTVFRQAALLEPLEIALDPDASPLRLFVSPEERRRAADLLASAGLNPGLPYVILQATAGAGRALKQWIPGRFAELADRIYTELGLSTVLTGHSTDDLAITREVLRAARNPIIDLVDRTNLRTLSAVIQGAEMYVGCDTGPMHIAAALDVPGVVLFGPTDPVQWRPRSAAPWEVVRAGLACSPCGGKSCPYDVECMRSIEVADVMSAVRHVRAGFPALSDLRIRVS